MIAGVEYLITLENLMRTQKQIWNDSCDVGIEENIFNPNIRRKIREACKGLNEIYKSEKEITTSNSKWICFVPYEEESGIWVGVKITVSFHDIYKKKFFTIMTEMHSQKECPFRD